MEKEILAKINGIEITVKNFDDFVKDYSIDKQCEFCQNREWQFILKTPPNPQENILVQYDILEILLNTTKIYQNDGILASRAGIPLFGLACSKCGHLRLFLYDALIKWIKEKNKNE